MAVAIAAGRNGVDTLLVASQVALSIVLPFIVFPLLYLTSSKSIMAVKKPLDRPLEDQPEVEASEPAPAPDAATTDGALSKSDDLQRDLENAAETIDY